jgi:hypothetical protein
MVQSPLSICSQLPAHVAQSFSWRVLPLCLVVSGSDVGLQIDSVPLPESPPSEEADDSFAAVASWSKDGHLSKHLKALVSRVPDAALRQGDFIVDIRQVSPREVSAARAAASNGVSALQPSGAASTSDPRHPCLGSAMFPTSSLLLNTMAVIGPFDAWPIEVMYNRLRLLSTSQVARCIRAASNAIYGLTPDVCAQEPVALLSFAAGAEAPAGADSMSYAAALGMPGFVGSVLQIIALRYAPENTYDSCVWKPPLPSLSNRLFSSHGVSPTLHVARAAGPFQTNIRAPTSMAAASSAPPPLTYTSSDSARGVAAAAILTVPKKASAVIVISDDSEDDYDARGAADGRGDGAVAASVSSAAKPSSALISLRVPPSQVRVLPLAGQKRHAEFPLPLPAQPLALAADSRSLAHIVAPSSVAAAAASVPVLPAAAARNSRGARMTLRPRGRRHVGQRDASSSDDEAANEHKGSSLTKVSAPSGSRAPDPARNVPAANKSASVALEVMPVAASVAAAARVSTAAAKGPIKHVSSAYNDDGDVDDAVEILAAVGRDMSECAVCLTELAPHAGGQQRWQLMPCGHDFFCGGCVRQLSGGSHDQRLQLPGQAAFKQVCPLCRQSIARAAPKMV